MSVQALQSDVHISFLPDREMVISAQVSTASEATRAVAAVADSYVAYVTSKNAPGGTGRIHPPVILYVSSGAPVSLSTDVLETSGLGALCGALIGVATGTVALIPRNRRLRII